MRSMTRLDNAATDLFGDDLKRKLDYTILITMIVMPG